MVMHEHDQCATDPLQPLGTLDRWFPAPQFLCPRTSGIDISDNSIKVMTLLRTETGTEVASFAQDAIPAGIVEHGVVKDPAQLGAALDRLVETAHAPRRTHIALPEEPAYVFMMSAPDVRKPTQVRIAIEFEFEGRVPLKPEAAVYDYDILSYHPDGVGADIAVSVFPKTIVEGYLEALRIAHIEPVSFEIESRSIARSIVAKDMEQASLVVDFGRARTGIAILKGQVPIFTSTVEVGGDTITNIIMKELKVDEIQAEAYKNEHGITIGKDNQVAEVIMGTAAALADEIVRHHRYWDSLRNETGERVTPIAEVLLTGGSSNLRGLPEYIAARVQSPTLRADVWRNVCLFDRYIPSVTSNHALGLSTVIGLALRGI